MKHRCMSQLSHRRHHHKKTQLKTYSTLSSSPAPATSTSATGIRTMLDPMPRAATSKALAVAAHLHNLNRKEKKTVVNKTTTDTGISWTIHFTVRLNLQWKQDYNLSWMRLVCFLNFNSSMWLDMTWLYICLCQGDHIFIMICLLETQTCMFNKNVLVEFQ